MNRTLSFPGAGLSRLGLLSLLALAGCGERTLTSPPTESPDFARGARAANGPTVTSTNPSFAPRGTTLSVHVFGSGYDQGSRAIWALHGDTTFTVTRIKTNSTTFVSSTELTANITIQADAAIDAYDVVVVMTTGKKGIGIELFAVTLDIVDLGLGDFSTATAINGSSQIVGRSASGAFVWQAGVVAHLGPLPGSTGAQAEDINASGWVVGTSSTATGCRAVLWRPKTGGGYNPPLDLGTLGGSCSEATAINDNGVVAGDSKVSGDAVSHAVIWDANGQIHDIHTVQGGESFTWGINALGQVVGQWNGPTYQQAFRYTPGTGMELLPGLGGPQGVALDINGLGQVVGWSGPSVNDPLRATLWQGGSITDLGTLGGKSSVGFAITDDGRVVGRSETAGRRGSVQYVAFVWTAGDGMRSLGSVTGKNYTYAQALDINTNGWIVGENGPLAGAGHATLWRPKLP